MNFRILSLQPVAEPAGAMPRVQLPAAGRMALFQTEAASTWAVPPQVGPRHAMRQGPAGQRAQHRAQCRAACMSKANF